MPLSVKRVEKTRPPSALRGGVLDVSGALHTRQMLLHRAARDIDRAREFVHCQSGLRLEKFCQQPLLGIADNHGKSPIRTLQR